MIKEENNKLSGDVLVYEVRPEDFFPKVEIAAIYIDVEGRVLLLKNSSHKKEAAKWGVPAGKLEYGEMPAHGASRELFEETGIEISHEKLLQIGKLYIRKPEIDYIYHIFGVKFDHLPEVCLSNEHVNYRWITQKESVELDLMQAAKQPLDFFFQWN